MQIRKPENEGTLFREYIMKRKMQEKTRARLKPDLLKVSRK